MSNLSFDVFEDKYNFLNVQIADVLEHCEACGFNRSDSDRCNTCSFSVLLNNLRKERDSIEDLLIEFS